MAEKEERTEAPTQRKRSEAREEGNIAKSQDLNAAVVLLGAMILLGAFGSKLFGGFRSLVKSGLAGDWSSNVANTGDAVQILVATLVSGVEIIIPIILGIIVVAVISNLLQSGFIVSVKSIQPKFSKISPLKGIANLFTIRKVMKLNMDIFKISIIALIVVITIYFDMPRIISLVTLEPGASLAAAASLVYWLGIRIGLILLLLALLDYSYQKWQHEQDLRMTKQEVKEDFKRMEGDPLMKQRRARIARQISMQRIAQNVPQADVVVINPTHFAVALRYDSEKMNAPKVVAKGADFLALRIRQIATANAIPIVERKALAQALYKTIEVGQEVPPEHFAAVAEILAYVYRLSGRRIA